MTNIDLITYPNMFCGVYVCTCTHICVSVYLWACGGAPAASPAILSSTITFLQDGVDLSLAWCLLLTLGGLLSNPWAFSFLCFPALGCQTVRWGNSLHSSGDEIQDLMCKTSFLPISPDPKFLIYVYYYCHYYYEHLFYWGAVTHYIFYPIIF